MFREDELTSLTVKLTRQEKTTRQAHQNCPTKKAKPTGKRTSGHPIHKLQTTRGMSLQTDEYVVKLTDNNTREKPASSISDNDDQSSTSSEAIAPSPERQTQKLTPPTITTVPQQKSTRNRQSALSTAFGNHIPINAIIDKDDKGQKSFRFVIDLPPDKLKTENYPCLKLLIQELGFTEKTPQYQACVNFIKALCPENSRN